MLALVLVSITVSVLVYCARLEVSLDINSTHTRLAHDYRRDRRWKMEDGTLQPCCCIALDDFITFTLVTK